jgi:putative RecB family exonuclease
MQNSSLSQVVGNELYISNSQINTYLNCSLRYKFQYVENLPPERVSIALIFGSSIHAAAELHNRTLKNQGRIEPIKALWERFEDCLNLELDNTDVPVIYKRDMPDRAAAVEMGKALVETFHQNIDYTGYEIIDVELPLMAQLYDIHRQPVDHKLFGILDLVLRDTNGEILVIDLKTAAKSMSQSTANSDSQMTCYSTLLASKKYVFPAAPVRCRFDILRKLKKPKLEQVYTTRSAEDRKRFCKIAVLVLEAVAAGIFPPRTSWMCADCSYQNACRDWK